jgi:hypothetical protein
MTTSFYYHSPQFDGDEFGQKCCRNISSLRDEPAEINVERTEQVDPGSFVLTELTDEWLAADFDEEDNITRLDCRYDQLSDYGLQKEVERLRDKRVDYFVFVLELIYDGSDDSQHITVLVEDEGQSQDENISLHVEEVVTGQVEIDA